MNDFGSEAEALRSNALVHALPARAFGQIFALSFALEQFRQDLGDLLARTRELAGKTAIEEP